VKAGALPPGGDPEAPLRQFDELCARGERQAARQVLAPLELPGDARRRAATIRLATLDEQEGKVAEAVARWERLLADDIDDDRAWLHLSRLRPLRDRSDDPLAAVGPAGTISPGGGIGGGAAPTLDTAAGVSLGRFEILRELGRGSSATVYLASDPALDLPLALKVLHATPAARERDRDFFHEARAVAGLRHGGVVAIYDVDEPARTLVMEYIAGGTLRDRLRATAAADAVPRGLPPADVLHLGAGLLDALDYVHRHGVVHGDLSPRNVLMRLPGGPPGNGPPSPVLVDFGIARVRGSVAPGPGASSDGAAGTPLYLAPEQFRGSPQSERTDLFAVGALLWEALVGRPMRARADLVAGHARARPLPPEVGEATARIAPPLPALIAALTAADPLERPGADEALAMLLLPSG
jgi:eukaryotic-like serine/threonine-protein kinase